MATRTPPLCTDTPRTSPEARVRIDAHELIFRRVEAADEAEMFLVHPDGSVASMGRLTRAAGLQLAYEFFNAVASDVFRADPVIAFICRTDGCPEYGYMSQGTRRAGKTCPFCDGNMTPLDEDPQEGEGAHGVIDSR